jgi:hypothetical protein
MKDWFDWIRIKSRTRTFFNEAVGPKADALNERQRLAKLLYTALDIAMDKGMFAIWRPVTEVNKARENQTLSEQFAKSGGKPPRRSITDLDGLHMRPLMFHLERSVIPRIFEDPRPRHRDWSKINEKIDKLVAYNQRAPSGEGARQAIQTILARPFDSGNQADPGYTDSKYPESTDGITGFQSLKALSQICAIMLTHAAKFRLSATEQDVLRETLRAYDYCTGPGYRPELPAAAQKDMDDFHREMAMGGMRFEKNGAIRMKAEPTDYPGAYDEALFFDDAEPD